MPCLDMVQESGGRGSALTAGLWFLGPGNEGLLSVSSRKKGLSPVCLSASQLDSILHLGITQGLKRCSMTTLCFNKQKQLIKSQRRLTLSITELVNSH